MKVLYKLLPILGFSLLSFKAVAQQTHLSCVVPAEKKTPAIYLDFTLDEAAGTVAFYWNNQSRRDLAIFTADKVTWNKPFYLGTMIRRTINRVTLEYIDETIDGKKVSITRGTCTVATPPIDRKF